MQGRILIVLALAAAMAVPTTAVAGHITYYRYNPVEHDDQGRSDEPDGLGTSVLGPAIAGCNVEIPVGGAFASRCNLAASPDGRVVAPGCTGDGPNGAAVRRQSGQCGLWTIGAGYTSTVVPPDTIPPPASELGQGGDRAPGLAASKHVPIRFLDTQVFWASQPPGSLPNTHQLALTRILQDLGAQLGQHLPMEHGIVPGDAIVHVWFGEWTDLNGNGVIDHFTPGTAGANLNEFTWLGNCQGFAGEREPDSIAQGLCKEDPNANVAPAGAPCADAASTVACARSTVLTWLWPGNHGANGIASDFPLSSVGNWLLAGDCDAACQDEFDPLLGPQGDLTPEIRGIIDATGDPDDAVRRWYSGTGGTTSFYDDGLLVSMVTITGINCDERAATLAGTLGACTFRDVDRYPSLDPALDDLLLGPGSDDPNGGLKGDLRGAWNLARDAATPARDAAFGLLPGFV